MDSISYTTVAMPQNKHTSPEDGIYFKTNSGNSNFWKIIFLTFLFVSIAVLAVITAYEIRYNIRIMQIEVENLKAKNTELSNTLISTQESVQARSDELNIKIENLQNEVNEQFIAVDQELVSFKIIQEDNVEVDEGLKKILSEANEKISNLNQKLGPLKRIEEPVLGSLVFISSSESD